MRVISADSGNGGHLLLPIDLANAPENVELLKRVLEGIGSQFDDEVVTVDRATYNPSRGCKIWFIDK